MAALDSSHFYKKLEHKALDPLVFLFGEESFLIERALKAIKRTYFGLGAGGGDSGLDSGLEDFNYNLFYAQDCDVLQVKESVETYPLMAQLRVVVLKQAHLLKDSEWELLLPLFENPVSTTLFVLTAEKTDKRKKAQKRLFEQAQSLEFKPPFDNQIPGWIQWLGREHQVEISADGAELIHRLVGSNLAEIDSEIEKIKLFVGKTNEIGKTASEASKMTEVGAATEVGVNDIAAVISQSRSDNVFTLTTSIGKRDFLESMFTLKKLLSQNESEVAIVLMISRHLRILLSIKVGLQNNLSSKELIQVSGVSPYFLNQYLDHAKLWTIAAIESSLLKLVEIDKQLKSSSIAPSIWLESFILSLVGP